ncbi:MAG: thiamine pyrophosphate-dependent enzyme, partial [Planctomycetota bacterium]|nr:thiamine pyrophosphate-dependent enzyme [Planctomycetota bacterium]
MAAAVNAVSPALNGWNAEYIDAQYQQWKADPSSVSEDLRQFFQGFDLAHSRNGAVAPALPGPSAAVATASDASLAHAVSNLVLSYREVGHLCAAIDPFGRERPCPETLLPSWHGLAEQHLNNAFQPHDMPLAGPTPLTELLEILDETYCRTVGVEFMHIQNADERSWFIDRLERTRNRPNLDKGDKVHLLWQLHRAEMFETFLHKRYVGQKRFSLEGGESLIPLLDRLIERAADLSVEELVLGMPHRGRLNVLNNILGKTYEQIFTEFEANWDEDFVEGGGDVKYHLGYSGDRTLRNGKTLRLVLSSNPSHLESVNGVVLGRCRAKQRLRADHDRNRVVPVLIHGDAAFIAQGPVMEVLNMSKLEGYTCGGCIHVIVNNLIGFTTGPDDARSSMYCTDVAKMIDAPV